MVNKTVRSIDGILINIINFNYKYLLVNYDNKIKDTLIIRLDEDIILNCSFQKELSYNNREKMMLFKIDNYKEVNMNDKLVNIVTMWEKEFEKEELKSKKRVKIDNDEFNEYDYL